MHPLPAFMTAGMAVVWFLCGLFSASASAFVRSKGVVGERERENGTTTYHGNDSKARIFAT